MSMPSLAQALTAGAQHLGEALLDQGDREEGLLELDLAMRGFEQINDRGVGLG